MKIKVLLATALFAAAASSQAASLYVDGVNGSDAKDCTSIANACATPWRAYDVSAAGDEILITKGSYVIPPSGHYLIEKTVSFKGGYDTTFDFLKKSSDANSTVITGNDAMGYRLFLIQTGHNGWLVFDTLTITGANSPTNDHGALLTHETGGWLRLSNVVMKDNHLKTGEGAVKLSVADDKLEVINSRFENNSATTSGGAIGIVNKAIVTIKNSAFIDNKAASGGGAIYSSAADIDLTIEDSYFTGNTGSLGGALSITSNRGTRASQITINRSSFTHNKSTNNGGAIYAEQGTWQIDNTTVSNNTITNASHNGNGGGIANNGALMKLRYVTIVGNHSEKAGGGLGVGWDAAGKAEIEGSIITGNTSYEGSGNADDVWLYNTSTIVDRGYNLIGSNANANMFDNTGPALNFHTWFDHKVGTEYTSQIITGASAEVVALEAKSNGGKSGVFTNMIPSNSVARDAIPNTGGLFYGVGKTATYPFTSLDQVNAYVSRDGYGAHDYHFDLGGSYDGNLVYTAGTNGPLIFSAPVSADGYITLATDVWDTVSNKLDFDAQDIPAATPEPAKKRVKYLAGLCSGSIATDARGLPRSDRVKAEENVHGCDIGAVEFNDYFRFDCWGEDGQRPDNSITNTQLSWCGNPFDANPRDLLENAGAFHWAWSLWLLALYGLRRRYIS